MITAETIRQALQCDDPACPCHKPNGLVHCPGHADSTPSLSVTERGERILVKDFGGCSQDRVISALKEKGLWPSSNGDRAQVLKPRIVSTYDYEDDQGRLVFQVVRREPKDFRQRRPNPQSPGKWIWNLQGVARIPYRLPELLKASRVYIVEGEKDADNLVALGFTATCNAGGAGKWRKDYNPHFQSKDVVILPDNDDPGRAHALDVARNLHGMAASVKVVELPGLPEKEDVSHWLKAGGTKEKLLALVEASPEYDPAQALQAAQEDKAKPTQAELLIKLAAEAELFHDLNRKGYATIPVDGHLETWPIKSMAFRDWLRGLFYKAHGKPPGGQALQDALDTLAAQARFDGQEHEIHVRVAHAGGKIYVDLANDEWQAIEITNNGWRVVDRPPVKFRRPRGLAPMPTPEPGGNLADLKSFINCRERDWPLVVAWLIGSFSPGPYPVMIFQGEQGAAKSTTARALKNMVDPGHSPQRTAPRDIRDLMIFASNSWSLSFDNLSSLKDWLSDGFCRLATGGGLSTRELYSDSDETILYAMRPVILNGIDSLVSRADLADRAILLELPRIENNGRRREVDLWRAFETPQPGIMGAVFNALSAALANVHKVKLTQLPRMADFATWIVAAEPALPWPPGTFLAAYTRNRAAVVEHSLEGDPVAVAVRSFMEHRQEWEGTPTELLNELTEVAGELVSRGKAWPKAPNGLTNRIRRAAPFLRASGIEFESGWGEKKGRKLAFRKHEKKTVGTVGTVGSEENQGVISHDTSHDTEASHDKTVGTVGRSWDRKSSDGAASHDTHDTHDKKPSFSKTEEEPSMSLFSGQEVDL
jgi:5S rRNA maturation endonuclease (ribonuclease M5)